MCQPLCNESIRVGLMVQKSEDEIERKTANVSRRLDFDNFAPIDSSRAQCFTLPRPAGAGSRKDVFTIKLGKELII
eukprot:scaffold39725_cov956-Skeletonema_marinoi.AAC.1